jgi:hypothetical protein
MKKVELGKKIKLFLSSCLASHRFNDAKKKAPGKKAKEKKIRSTNFFFLFILL